MNKTFVLKIILKITTKQNLIVYGHSEKWSFGFTWSNYN